MSGLVHVSLFSGVGGVDLAMQEAGIPTVLACEADKAARGVLADRFPETELSDDVRTLTGDHLRRLADPRRTVLSAGFPCQDLSVAGARRGMVEGSGTRSALYWEVDRLLGDFRPAWVVLENVPGLLSSRGGRDMGAVLGSLAQRGYGFAYRVLDARYFGVPQRRRRVVVVGRLGDDGRAPAQVLLEPEGLPGDLAAGIAPRPRATAGVGGGVEVRGVAPLLEVGARTGASTDDPRAGIGIGVDGDPMFTLQASKQHGVAVGVLGDHSHALTAEGHDASEGGTGRGTPIVYQQHGTNVGPMGTLRKGDGGVTSGVPFVVAPQTAATLTAGVSTSPGVNPPGRRQEDDHNIVAYAAEQTSTLQAGGGERGYRIDAESAAGGQLVATYQKVIRSGARDADGNLPPEVWAHRDVAATLNLNDLGSESRAVEVVVHNPAGQELARADAQEANPRALLHRLRDALGEEGLREWCSGVAAALQPAPVLRQGVHEGGLPPEAEDLYRQLVDHAQAGTTPAPGWAVRGLPVDPKRGRTSHQWELAGQLAEQLEAALSRVSLESAPTLAVRRLTPLETERLQGFPDGHAATSWGKAQADSPRYKQMGNAVAVPVFAWVARRIAAVHTARQEAA